MTSRLTSRRNLLARAFAGMASMSLCSARPASAEADPFRMPARIALSRFYPGKTGRMAQEDRDAWQGMARRLGGVVGELRFIYPSRVVADGLPTYSEGASAALAARIEAQRKGFDYLLVYAVLPEDYEPGQNEAPTPEDDRWARMQLPQEETSKVAQIRHGAAKSMRWVFSEIARVGEHALPTSPPDMVLGEAHLIDVRSGQTIASSWAETEENRNMGVFREKADPEAEILDQLSLDMTVRMQTLAAEAYGRHRSIAD